MTPAAQSFERLITIMNELREGCPWDKKQTIHTLRQQTLEESYELTDAIINEDWKGIKEELGDLLLHLVFYTRIAGEQGRFTMPEMIDGICDKLIRRHPHIYNDTAADKSLVEVKSSDDVKRNWEALKLKEGKTSVLEGIPKAAPSMLKAMRIQQKAAQVGFEFEGISQVWDKVREEEAELHQAIADSNQTEVEKEFGDLLFSLINLSRFFKVDAEAALALTNQKFISRFTQMEAAAKSQGRLLADLSLTEQDALWTKNQTKNGLNFLSLHTYLRGRSLPVFAALFLMASFITGLYFKSQPSVAYHRRVLEQRLQNEQKDAAALLTDTALLRRLFLQQESPADFDWTEKKAYGLFLFAETVSGPADLRFWNNQKILPPQADFSLPDGTYFQQLQNGYYVVQKKGVQLSGVSGNVVAYILLPVLNQYYVKTNYLVANFVHDKEADKQVSIAGQPTPFAVHEVGGQPLFYLQAVASNGQPPADAVTFALRLAALFFLLLYAQVVAEAIHQKKRAAVAIGFLTITLVSIRLLLFVFPNGLGLRQFTLFDPSVYASNWANRSLGDLLLNALVFCWVILFTWQSIGPVRKPPFFLRGNRIYIAAIVAMLVLLLVSFELATMVHDLVANSTISFNVTDFFSLDAYTVWGLIILALLTLSYYYFSRLLFRLMQMAVPNALYRCFAIAATGLLLLSLHSNHSVVLYQLPVLLWVVVYALLLSREGYGVNRVKITAAGILFWLFIFSLSLAVLILQANNEKEWRTRKSVAGKVDELTDPSNEKMLRIALTYLDNRFLTANFPRFQAPVQNRAIRDSIISVNLSAYRNQYNTKLYVFDAGNAPVNNDDALSYAELNTIFTVQSKPTGIPDLFYHETSFDKFTYISKRTIGDSAAALGTFFILSTPKQYQNSDALYPELFRQVARGAPENSPLYSSAVYEAGQLHDHTGRYPFRISISGAQLPAQETERRELNGYDEMWYRVSNKKVVVVARKKDSLVESFTLFSYLFCAFLALVGLLQLMVRLLEVSGRGGVPFFSGLTIRSQIHGTVIFISVVSFLIIGAATISFFIIRYNRNNIDRLSRTAGITVHEMERRIADAKLATHPFNYTDSSSAATLQAMVQEIADVHNVDVNVYDLQGALQVSSDEEVYTKGILSTRMHPTAWYGLHNQGQVQLTQDETLSSLTYLSSYTAVRDDGGNVYAYLNIPYFSSQLDLNQEISNFLVTIMNLNAAIFLLAGVVSLFITNRITRSFSLISDKMKAITLGKTNETIVWRKDDEIGELVKQYNKMVGQLEESAEALAKSEREGAWREMARQVAHEIKNPLTPMKLSIQFLQKAISGNNHQNIQALTTSVANTLIEQIDHLAKIAADFSQFANIGNRKTELVNLHAIIHSLVNLYGAEPSVHIEWKEGAELLELPADKTHMNRLFTNLLANAIDACRGKQDGRILIAEQRKEKVVILSVTDNGEGISDEAQANIFAPNFTTKTSGTGLGLAMCKSIVEQARGAIWFTTTVGEGTTFYVQLPLH